MPLTPKGKKIMASMRKQYGSKKGEEVFYASKNKGTIEGVDKTEETKMSYLDKVFSLDEGAAKRVNPGKGAEGDEYVSGGKTGRPTLKNRLLKQGTKKGRAMADVAVKQHTAGPKGKLPDWTEYQRIGALMAEALGHRVDELAFLAPALKAGASMAGRYLAKKAAVGAAKKVAGSMKKPEKPEEPEKPEKSEKPEDKEMEESIWNLYRDMAILIAETADAGFVKSKLAKDAEKRSGAKRVGDLDKPGTNMSPFVKSIARRGNAIVSRRVRAKTNVKTGAALQIGQNDRRKKSREAGEGLPPESADVRRADAQLDVKKRAGDR